MIVKPEEVYPEFKKFEGVGIPEELQGYPQFVVWKLEQLPKDKKPRKVPYSPITHGRSGCNDKYRKSWGSYLDVCKAMETGQYSGIGFVLTADDPFIAIDFDHCVNGGVITDWVEKTMHSLESYTELSPSGTGIHIIVRGIKPGKNCKKNCPEYDIEMYEQARFITLTGHFIENFKDVNGKQSELVELYNDRLADNTAPQPAASQAPAAPAPAPAVDSDDKTLLEKIRKSKQGAKFAALMSGSTAGYGSEDNEGHSEADAALCMILAFWTQNDASRIDRIFRTSGLMRPKWDEKRGAKTYGQMTVDKAISKTGDVYNPKKNKGSSKSNVVPIKKAKSRKVQTENTGFQSNTVLFPEPAPWPDLGSRHFIDPKTGGLYLGQESSDSKDLIALRPIWIYSIARDEFNERYRIIKFYDEDFIQRTACFPANWFAKGKDGNVWSSLMSQGMILNTGKEKYVARYLDALTSVCTLRSWAASKLGWFVPPEDDDSTLPVFVLPDQVLGKVADDKEVYFQSLEEINSKTISARGKLKDWTHNIAHKAKGNHLLMFAIACGLAGGMTKLASIPSGGFHFWGIARTGKTALLQAAASVWGNASDPQVHSHKTCIRKWNATNNGLEATAQLHNDIVLCLDEIGELEPADLGRLIYTLTGGTPKSRMKESGGLKNQAFWHIMLMSSGEQSTEQILKSIGETKRGGQTHRLPDIRIDGLPNGIVQVSDTDCSDFIDQLKKDCARYYGTAGPTFVSWLIKEMATKGTQKFINEINDNIKSMERLLADGITVSNEIRAVIKRMSAIAVAAMYAGEAQVVDWPPHLINECAVFIRNLWLADMEDNINELDKALANLRGEIISNMANFEDINDENAKPPIKMMGYKNYDFIMVLPKSFDSFCGSYNSRQIINELIKKEMVKTAVESGKLRLSVKIPQREKNKERPRCYWVNRSFLDN